MSSPGAVAYNPSDVTQSSFLSSLALGENGNQTNPWTTGFGGTNLSGSGVDAYGFPQWSGLGNSHAAGTFQFQPGTWDSVAKTYGLNFSNPADQQAGAWYLAQQTYAQNTGGSLMDALKTGNFPIIQAALKGVWPSVTGNAAAPQGLANDLAAGVGSSAIQTGSSALLGGAATAAQSGTAATSGSGTGVVATIENFVVRGGLIIIGGIVVIVALWYLLAKQDIVPTPAELAKDVVA